MYKNNNELVDHHVAPFYIQARSQSETARPGQQASEGHGQGNVDNLDKLIGSLTEAWRVEDARDFMNSRFNQSQNQPSLHLLTSSQTVSSTCRKLTESLDKDCGELNGHSIVIHSHGIGAQ